MSPEAEAAWSAYQAMAASKNAYFGFLSELDLKYRESGSPSIAENVKLENLLTEHNASVQKFTTAMAMVVDEKDRGELVIKMQQSIEGK